MDILSNALTFDPDVYVLEYAALSTLMGAEKRGRARDM